MSKWRKIKENREEKEALEEEEEHQRPKNRNRSDNCSTEIAIAGSNNIPSLAISPSFCARHSRAGKRCPAAAVPTRHPDPHPLALPQPLPFSLT